MATTPISSQEPSLFEEDWKQSLDFLDPNSTVGMSFLHPVDPLFDPFTPDENLSPHSSIGGIGGLPVPRELGTPTGSPQAFDIFSDNVAGPSTSYAGSPMPTSTPMNQAELDAMLDSFNPDSMYPEPSITGSSPTTPYFSSPTGHIEPFTSPQHQMKVQQGYAPSPFRHQMSRRSVSEPPTEPPEDFNLGRHHYQLPPSPQGPMVFHRQGHFIGKPIPDEVARVKGRGRGRTTGRYQPYARVGTESPSRSRKGQLASAPTSMPSPPVRTTGGRSAKRAGASPDEVPMVISEGRLQELIAEAVANAVRAERDANAVPSIESGGDDQATIVVGNRSNDCSE